MYSDDIVSLLIDHSSPWWRIGGAKFFKNWHLNAWKCTQITLNLYNLIIGAPGEGRVLPEFSKVGY